MRLKYDAFLCDCRNLDHVVWITGDEDYVYINVKLNHFMNFFQRLRVAVGFVLGKQADYKFPFDDVLLSKEDAQRMVDTLQKHISQLK